ncbi:MAG: type I-B CRISPR-associated endonuclease Cas1b [Saprospiraceae bacterium]|nr:type I-B CRISPR-associated endonuclease Cas1b [Saprospiraceae bacterium]
MKRSFYLFNPGRMSRKDNTLHFIATDAEGNETGKKNLPIETIDNLYIFGSVDANSSLYNFLGKAQVPVHFFDYYDHYTGSFMPKDYLLAGKMQVEQTKAYMTKDKRMAIAKAFIEGASFNMLKNLKYYDKRGRDAEPLIERIETYRKSIPLSKEVPELMGLEGNCRQTYYDGFELIINDFEMGNRTKNPPSNEVNAMISFGNALSYSLTLDTIYHTQLNPTISFLHEPGARRYSLALDISEIFKPILVDRMIFKLLNKREIRAEHFDNKMNSCRLNDKGRTIVVKEWDERLKETIQHRSLNKKVSYKHLVKLECYKLQKHILGLDAEYKPFKIWW